MASRRTALSGNASLIAAFSSSLRYSVALKTPVSTCMETDRRARSPPVKHARGSAPALGQQHHIQDNTDCITQRWARPQRLAGSSSTKSTGYARIQSRCCSHQLITSLRTDSTKDRDCCHSRRWQLTKYTDCWLHAAQVVADSPLDVLPSALLKSAWICLPISLGTTILP